jgi:chromosome segregation ATPase
MNIHPSQSDDNLMQEIHDLQVQLQTTNLARMKNDLRQQLEQWCTESHQIVERFFDRKSRESDRHIDETFDQYRTKINRIRATLSAANRRGEINERELHSLRFTLGNLRRKIQSFEQCETQFSSRCPAELHERSLSSLAMEACSCSR